MKGNGETLTLVDSNKLANKAFYKAEVTVPAKE